MTLTYGMPQDEEAAVNVHYQAAHRRLVAYGALSYSLTEASDNGGLESTYRLHKMDMASRRLVPFLLDTTERTCAHMACDMVLLNSLCAGYMVESGLGNDHSSQLAYDLLKQQGMSVTLD